ncbi:MAG: NAD(P)/FAD-dependent oxidoreductase, partial [Nocardia sp.]|nr:NAD(P)/FAD-dependent oxidoreductase [Nocardia sp.]
AEPEAAEVLRETFAEEGIAVRTGAETVRVDHDGTHFTVRLDSGDPLRANELLLATGRRTDLAALGVGAVGLDESAHHLDVDEHLRAAEGVWAIGDVTGRGAFTHMSMYQARIAAADILGSPTEPARYHAVPSATFTDPEVGTVGLTEAQARAAGLTVWTGRAKIPESSRGWLHGPGNAGFVKLVADAERGILVGASSVGPHGGEVLGALTLAVQAEVPITTMREMIYAYPTYHRAIESALADLG